MWNEWIHDIGGIIHDNSDHINGSGEVIVVRRINFVSVVGEARAGAGPGLRALYADGTARRRQLHPPYWVLDMRDKRTVYPIKTLCSCGLKRARQTERRRGNDVAPARAPPDRSAPRSQRPIVFLVDRLYRRTLRFFLNSWYENDTQTMGFRPFIGTLFFVTP